MSSTFTPIDVSGAINTYAYGHGFLDANGVFTPLDAPGASQTGAYDVVENGRIAGFYVDNAGAHGFLPG